MAGQLRLVNYITNFQEALTNLVNPIKVYNSFNPNYAKDSQFIVWDFSGIHQEVYSGDQPNKGIDRPVFDINVCTSKASGGLLACAQTVDTILQAWHGAGSPYLLNMLEVSKIDITVQAHEYDEDSSLHAIFLSCQFDVGTPS